MDRRTTVKALTGTLAHLRQMTEHIEEQRRLIANLEARGNTEKLEEARLLLRDLETIRAGYFSDRNHLIEYLAGHIRASHPLRSRYARPSRLVAAHNGRASPHLQP